MPNNHDTSQSTQAGQVTIGHLLLAIALLMPVCAATTELNHSGGGWIRYLVAVPAALALGAIIVLLDWNLGRIIWLRSQRYSSRLQNAIALVWFALEISWIVLGSVSGFKLGALVAAHLPR